MSDIFFNNSRVNFTPDANEVNKRNESSKSYWDEQNAAIEQKNQAYLEDLQKYSVNIPQEQYNIIKDVIADAENPEDEAYRWASALELNNQYGMPVQQAYANLDQITAAIWGDKYQFTPKTNFKAIVDNGKLGLNTLKMGMLGTQIMFAEAALSPDVEDLVAKYDEIEAENAGLYDFQDRNFLIECLKFGAQSMPFTGYVAGASILGNLIAPGVGTAAGFAASMQNASGLEYMKLRKAGSDQTAAAGFALIAGSLEALVETSLGNVPAIAGKKSLTELIGEVGKQKIAGNLFKRLSYDGTFKSLALRMTKEYVKENVEEGLEEVWQDLIEKGTDALAAELGQYELEGVDAKSIAKDAWDNFKGGVMGSLVLGLPGTYIKSKADIKEFVNV